MPILRPTKNEAWEVIEALKQEGVPFEERMERRQVSGPTPAVKN